MTTANLSVGINTKPAFESLNKLKGELAKVNVAIPVTLDPKSISTALAGTKIKVAIDTADLASKVRQAVQEGMSGLKFSGGSIDTTQLKAGIDQIKQYMATAANDPALGNALSEGVKKGSPKAASEAKAAGKAAGKAFVEGEEEEAKKARISYRVKEGAGTLSTSEKSQYTTEQVKAKAAEAEADRLSLAAQKEKNKTLLQRIDLMRTEYELRKKTSAEELKAFLSAEAKAGTAEMKARAQAWTNIATEAAKAEKAQRAAAARMFAEGKNLAPDNLTTKGKAQYGAQYAVSKGFSESLLPNGAAGLLQATDGLEKGIKKVGAAHTEATGKTKTHAAAMRDAHSAARGLASGMGMMWLTWGNIAPLLAGASLSHGFIQAMKAGSEFAYQLTFVKALGEETADSIGRISNAALELSKNSLYGPVELANGLRTLSQAGLSASESMKALPTVIDLATVGEMSMKDAAITLVGVMTAFNLEKTDFSKIGDVFAKAAAVSQTSVEQMTQAMKTASVVGEQYGASMGDTATALTLLAKMNITGTAAGTSLRNMLKELYSPTEKSAKLMKELGVSAQTATGELKPFPDIIFSLKGKLEEFNKASQVKILQGMFGERGAKEAVAMLSLTRTEWDKLNRTITESSGFMREVSAELEGTVKGSFKQAVNTLQVSLIEAYNSTEGAAGKLAGQLKETFGSAAFKESLAGIVSGMLSLTNALVAMAPALAMAAGGWLALRTAMIAASVWTSVTAALSGATLAVQTLGAVAAGAATTMTGSTGLLAAARMLPGVMGAAGASLIATTGLLPPLAIAIGVTGAAWYLFRDRTAEAMQQSSDAVASGVTSMRNSLSGILRDLHNLPAAASRKAIDSQRDSLSEMYGKSLEAKKSLEKSYGIKSDAEAKAFIAASTTDDGAGGVYTKTGPKYDAVTSYLKLKDTLKEVTAEFGRVNQSVETLAQSEAKAAEVKLSAGTKNYEGGGTGSGRADREAAKLENANVLAIEKRYQAELRTADAHYARLEKIENTSAQYGIKTKEEAENEITKLTEEHWTKRLDMVSTMSDEMSALLGKSVKLSEADTKKAKTFVETAQEEINTLREKISWIKKEAELKAQGDEIRFNRDTDKNKIELEKEQALRRQKIYGKAEDPLSRARTEGALAVELKFAKQLDDAEENLRISQQGSNAQAIADAMRRRDILLGTIAEQKAAMADMFEADTRHMQSAEYGWEQFWVKYQENGTTAAKVVEQSMESVTKNLEDAFSKAFETGKFDAQSMFKAILGDVGRLTAKLAVADLGKLLFGKGQNSGTVLGGIFGGGSGTVGPGGMISEEGAYKKPEGLGGLLTQAAEGLKKFWGSLTGTTEATENAAVKTAESVVKTMTKTTAESAATSSLIELATAARMAATAMSGSSGSGGGSIGSLLGGLFGGGSSGAMSTAAKYGTLAGSQQTAMLAAQDLAFLANGAAFTAQGVKAFAKGGTFSNSIVNSPTLFKFADGTGLMGEAGPEAIMPLARDGQGRLGVRYEGREAPQSRGNSNVSNNNINVTVNSKSGDPAEIRRSGAAVARQVASAVAGSGRYR